MRPIVGRDFWNEDVGWVGREKVTRAFRERCAFVGAEGEVGMGVRRVDYLRGRVVFLGLVRGRNGMWEIKTEKVGAGLY